jgi:hypothetical protein
MHPNEFPIRYAFGLFSYKASTFEWKADDSFADYSREGMKAVWPSLPP